METHVPAPKLRSPRSKKILFLFVGVFLAALFIGLNVWVYRLATKGKAPSAAPLPGGLMKPDIRSSATQNTPTTSPLSLPTPTPTPLQGPGTYACDPLGICNLYDDPIGKRCPKTFADPKCLGSCSDTSIQCPKNL